MLFFNLMVIGTMITISSYNWFSMWIGLEINLLSVIPLFKSNSNYFPAEASIKYFITQSLASTIILFSIIITMNMNEFLTIKYDFWSMMILNSALLTKLGAAPFHNWFPEVSEGLNWPNNLILMTWQKLAPSILLMYNINTNFLFFIVILSSMIGGIWGMNQTSLRKILAYSSINHLSWMIASMFFNKAIWLNYFIVYTLININIIMIFNFLKVFFLPQLFLILNYNKYMKLIFMFNFFSLGGLPPFLGFFPKWITLNFLIFNNFYTLSIIMVIFTLLTLYFYMRITFTTLTFSANENIIFNSKMNNNFTIIFNTLILSSLIICINLFNFY
uniref:NADH-ubiquinone oxidoreductase chain 2 n=1 Tax=Chaetocnema pelagica TaxID=1425542 RepID=A0A3G1GRS6_9CUCU|nr:NADH dehydrogenase subunit 2 [Chaetocnema pelagica]